MNSGTIRFTDADLQLFSAFSGDSNPLHLSDAYASRTAFGQRVVFGALGVIACLGRVPVPLVGLRELDAECRRPMFRNVDYTVEVSEQDAQQIPCMKWIVRLFDGSVQVLTLKVTLADWAPPVDLPASTCEPPRSSAQSLDASGINIGTTAAGDYCSRRSHFSALASRWGAGLIAPGLVEMIAVSSYLVGMEMPGETALFFRLHLRFAMPPDPYPSALSWRAAVKSVNNRLGLLNMSVSVTAAGSTLAEGECSSFIRPIVATAAEDAPALARDNALEGRVALVIGASRGLGAATHLAFQARGASVYTLSRTRPPGEDPFHEVGDATDPAALARLRDRILQRHGRLDILICNAFPPIVPLRIEPAGLHRIEDYIAGAVALCLAPMSAFLDLIDSSAGALVVISSAVVTRPVREWPHYTAAKQAVEALAQTAVMQYPNVSGLIVRPEKLLTEMVGTPIGRLGAEPPLKLAERIAALFVSGAIYPGKTEILSVVTGPSD